MAQGTITAWHYFLHRLLVERGPSCFECLPEVPLTLTRQHIDWLLLRRVEVGALRVASTLVHLWPLLPKVTIVEYKSASRGYRAREINRLLGYGQQYFAARADEVPGRDDLMLVLLVASRNATLDDDLREEGLREEALRPGYTRVHGGSFATTVVDLEVAARHDPDDLIALFTREAPTTAAAITWWYAHAQPKDGSMDPKHLEDFGDIERRIIESFSAELRLAGLPPERVLASISPEARLSGLTLEQRLAGLAPEQRVADLTPEQRLAGLAPEQRVAGLAPEQRVAGLAPEQRLADLTPAQQVLALSDEVLRALPESYLATLPEDVQRTVHERLGRRAH